MPSLRSLVLLASLTIGAPLARAELEPVHQGRTYDLVRVTDRAFGVFRHAVGSNAAIVLLDGGVLIVDTHASPAAAREIVRAVAELTDDKVRWVVNTHWHTDHMLGNAAYVASFPAAVEILSHHTARQDMERLAAGQLPVTVRFIGQAVDELDTWMASGEAHGFGSAELKRVERFVEDQRRLLPAMATMKPSLPTVTFDRSLIIHGPSPVHLLHFGPGHTRGDVAVYLPAEKVLIAGDLLTHPTLHAGESSHPVEWLSALRALAGLDWELAIPGHGKHVLEGKHHLALVTAILDRIVAQVRGALDGGASAREAIDGVDLTALRAAWVADHPGAGEAFDRASATFSADAAPLTYLDLTGRLPHGSGD